MVLRQLAHQEVGRLATITTPAVLAVQASPPTLPLRQHWICVWLCLAGSAPDLAVHSPVQRAHTVRGPCRLAQPALQVPPLRLRLALLQTAASVLQAGVQHLPCAALLAQRKRGLRCVHPVLLGASLPVEPRCHVLHVLQATQAATIHPHRLTAMKHLWSPMTGCPHLLMRLCLR